MRIAVSATGRSLDVEVDPRFGRCRYFIIVDPGTLEFEAVENTGALASGGAGIASAQMIANKVVQAVITGNCGPNAYRTLAAAGIQVMTGAMGDIRHVIEGYKAGRFQAASHPTVDRHSGMRMGGGWAWRSQQGDDPWPAILSQELEALKTQTQMMGQQLNEMLCRIGELEKKGG